MYNWPFTDWEKINVYDSAHFGQIFLEYCPNVG